MRKTYDRGLGIFKVGDDLNLNKEHSSSDAEAFQKCADMYKDVAKIYERLIDLAIEGDLKLLFADTHCIEVEAEETKVSDLVDNGVLHNNTPATVAAPKNKARSFRNG